MMPAVIGLDIGTTSTIAVLVAADGAVLRHATRPVTLHSPQPGWAEEDPAQWWDNACAVLREVAAGVPALAGICVTGMLPALLLLDAAGRPLRPAIQQSDARCAAEVEEMRAALDETEFLRRTGQGITQQLLAPRLRWLRRHEPDLTPPATICGSYDFINQRLTGVRRVDRNWALEAGFLALHSDIPADDLVALAPIPRIALPPTHPTHARLGAITAQAAATTGLPVGLPVLGGAADHIASALAAGLTEPGDVLLKFGGAGDVVAVAAQALPDRRLFMDHHLIPGLYAPNGCMAATGSTLRWLAALLGHDGDLAGLDAAAAATPPGAGGVRLLPFPLGEKTPIHDPLARGTITGLSLGHGAGHIWRAALEGTACGFRHHLDVLAELGQPARRLLASDGGSRSGVWMQIVADISGQAITRLDSALGSAAGAAAVARVGAGLAGWDDIRAGAALGACFTPNPAASGTVYRDYLALYSALRPFFARGAA